LKEKQILSRKFLFVSRWGESLDIVNSIKAEGNEVKFYIEDKPSKEIGYGFVDKVTHWEKFIDWADIIIFDYTGYGKIASQLRSKGKLVIGGTEYTDRLELDRNFGQSELQKHKIKVIPSKEFTSFHDAIKYIENNPNTYVIKPCGETQELKQLLFVGSDDEGLDVIRVLKAYEKSWGDDFGNFQLQRKVKGVEISIAAFFNGKEFIYPINITFEHKKLFPKELGVSTGEMGTSMFWTKDSPIFDATLLKFQSTLAKDNFVGHIDINCIVNGNGIYPLEFTSRFGYPQIFIQRSGINEPMGEFFIKIASKQNFKINVKKGFQVGAFIVVPPFPYDDKKTFNLFSKDAVVVFKKNGREGVHPMHLKKVNDEWLITGNTGIAVLVTGNGQTMKDAQKMMYNRISNVIINNGYYRTDIGDRWSEDSDKLWSWGLL
jgi:phosphoribosylamine--glycine ligase